jgi:hypothetical protein
MFAPQYVPPVLFLFILLVTYIIGKDRPLLSKSDQPLVPRILWTYLPKESPTPRQALCIKSWRKLHPAPEWQIHVLTPSTVHGYLHRLPNLHYQAAILRDLERWEETVALHALTEHGGIWIHPHTYLRKPLDKALGWDNKKEVFAFCYSKGDKPVLDKRLLASPPRNPFMEHWKMEYMRLQAYPSVEAYIKSLPTEAQHLPFHTEPIQSTEWVMTLTLQHALLQHPYPMESVHFLSVEDGPLRHLYEARGDPKKAEVIALSPASTEPIVCL